ncbi:LysR family transcriptional regulator [Herbaspirillum sp. meg3]|uniref:LysR family transcriptional regulator n=1 Tax=Herbaspirillum sp. meg3 TaxID=2025949 RepID=UPI000B98AC22|nr:LysR family transcriptional regulator [Herbaspirillum sp. meg3]ASU36917.1 LysR family transcriptional regulator [Herbaspirillum sp. meg3]
MDRLESMAIFLAVVDEGGFAAAARKMNISPPVVTRAVSDLETAIGVRLLTRTTRIVRVTDVGARYAEDCRRVLADITEMEDLAAGAHGAVRGRLVVTAPALFGRMYVTPIVMEYLRRYPEAEVECRFADRIINMMDEGIDVAVRIGHLPDSSYQAIPVGTVRRVVCASPDYLSKHGTPQAPDDLRQHVIVSSNGISTSPDWRFTKGDASTLVRVQPRMTVLSNDEAIIAALDGFGITRVLSYMVAPHLSDGRLVEVLREHETPTLPVHVVQHEGRHAARKVRAFLDLAVGELRGERPAKE